MENDDRALHDACRALWLATISLMTAFMNTRAPAQRCVLARRISSNLATLCEQPCFATAARTSFARLSARWQDTAERLAPPRPLHPLRVRAPAF